MNRKLCKVILSALSALSICSCRDEPEEVIALRDVYVGTSLVQIEKGGTADVEFSVRDSLCNFDKVELSLAAGNEKYCTLEGYSHSGVPGTYIATLGDCGGNDKYDVIASIAVTGKMPDGRTETLYSDRFEIVNVLSTSIGTGIPVVHIRTSGGAAVTSKENYIPATIEIEGGTDYPDLELKDIQIKGHGNSTWCWPKKPYLIKFGERTGVLGLPKHKRWILLANFMDRTLMRNITAYRVSSMTSLAYTPRCIPVELVFNGKHQGNYLLIEQIRVDKNRLDISEDGGWMFELDFHGDAEFQWYDRHGCCWNNSDCIPFSVKYPDPGEMTETQKVWAKDYINDVAEVLYGSGFRDSGQGYSKYLDTQSFADYWIVFEVMGNHELNNPGSVIFHKDKDGLLTAGPVWDFDWGVLSYNTSPQARSGLINGNAIWYAQLFKDTEFKRLVKQRWNALLPQLQTIPDFMEEQRELLAPSATLNFEMWNPADDRSMNGWQIINGDENMTFDAAVDRLKKIFNERLAVMGGIINQW